MCSFVGPVAPHPDPYHRTVLLAYVDESGDTGDLTQKAGASWTYSLGCLLVDAAAWPAAFDEVLTLRRNLRDKYGLPMRAEVKSNYLIRSGGPIRALNLAPAERRLIFRSHLRLVQVLPARAFAIVVDKRTCQQDTFDVAWETLLQRLELTSSREQQPFMVMHDEGENDKVRAWLRRARRYLTAGGAYGGTFRKAANLLVDDAVPRKSQNSYFIQMADLIAYAAFRDVIPPGANVAQVCPQPMWYEIGPGTHTAVSGLRPRAAPGIVLRF